MASSAPIIIVTGANSGVGYGIIQRLFLDFLSPLPQDALPQPLATPGAPEECEYSSTNGCTIIMACRSPGRAQSARDGLLKFLDEQIAKRSKSASRKDMERMESFRDNLNLDLLQLDLASSTSTLDFAQEVSSRYPYISHLICNAGCAPWAGIDWPLAIKCTIVNLKNAVTFPRYKLQNTGVLSDEGFGWTFQCNVFGHFILARALNEKLHASPFPSGARVIWTTSLDVEFTLVDIDWEDFQLVNTSRPYETSKYQTQMISRILDMESNSFGAPQSQVLEQTRQPLARTRSQRKSLAQSQELDQGEGKAPIRHLISHPGITSTAIFTSKLNFVTEFLMWLAFAIARLFGSTYHPISWMNGAIAATHLSLVPLALLSDRNEPVLYGSRARSTFFSAIGYLILGAFGQREKGEQVEDRWAEAYVERGRIVKWEENEGHARDLVEKCDRLYGELYGHWEQGKSTNGAAHHHKTNGKTNGVTHRHEVNGKANGVYEEVNGVADGGNWSIENGEVSTGPRRSERRKSGRNGTAS